MRDMENMKSARLAQLALPAMVYMSISSSSFFPLSLVSLRGWATMMTHILLVLPHACICVSMAFMAWVSVLYRLVSTSMNRYGSIMRYFSGRVRRTMSALAMILLGVGDTSCKSRCTMWLSRKLTIGFNCSWV